MHIFGPMTIEQYDEQIKQYASKLGVEVEIFHSNIEGEVINKFYQSHDGDVDAALINPAGIQRAIPRYLPRSGKSASPRSKSTYPIRPHEEPRPRLRLPVGA